MLKRFSQDSLLPKWLHSFHLPGRTLLLLFTVILLGICPDSSGLSASEQPDALQSSGKDDVATLREGRRLSKVDALQLERRLEQNPHDLSARGKLLGYYFHRASRLLGSAATIAARRRHIHWLISNYPDTDLAGMSEITIDPTGHDLADREGYEAAKLLWDEQIEKQKGNTTILRNAARFVQLHDKELAESYLKEANDSVSLGLLYAKGVLEITMQTHTGLPVGVGGNEQDNSFSIKARQALDDSSDPRVLASAIHYLFMRGPIASVFARKQMDIDPVEYGAELTRKLEAICQSCVTDFWPMYFQVKRMMARTEEEKKILAKRELNYLEKSPGLAADPDQMDEGNRRVLEASVISKLLNASFAAGELEKAKDYANRLLLTDYVVSDAERAGNEIHTANIILGRIALKQGDVKGATEHLSKAGRVSGGATLSSFGPNMSLAKELLEQGEDQVVLQYLDLCNVFWDRGKEDLERWSTTIRKGGMPDFGANLGYGLE